MFEFPMTSIFPGRVAQEPLRLLLRAKLWRRAQGLKNGMKGSAADTRGFGKVPETH